MDLDSRLSKFVVAMGQIIWVIILHSYWTVEPVKIADAYNILLVKMLNFNETIL